MSTDTTTEAPRLRNAGMHPSLHNVNDYLRLAEFRADQAIDNVMSRDVNLALAQAYATMALAAATRDA